MPILYSIHFQPHYHSYISERLLFAMRNSTLVEVTVTFLYFSDQRCLGVLPGKNRLFITPLYPLREVSVALLRKKIKNFYEVYSGQGIPVSFEEALALVYSFHTHILLRDFSTYLPLSDIFMWSEKKHHIAFLVLDWNNV